MSKDRLDIIETHRGFSIGWFNEAEDIEGDMRLGESVSGADMAEHHEATRAVRLSADSRDGETLIWDTVTGARNALRIARARLCLLRSKQAPLEPWERKALAAGWKPPKGRM